MNESLAYDRLHYSYMMTDMYVTMQLKLGYPFTIDARKLISQYFFTLSQKSIWISKIDKDTLEVTHEDGFVVVYIDVKYIESDNPDDIRIKSVILERNRLAEDLANSIYKSLYE